MSNRIAAACVVAVGVAALSACPTAPLTPVAPLAPGCDSQNCTVTVRVTDCTRHDGFEVQPDPVYVDAPKHIHWQLIASDQYRFADLGIDIKKNDGVFETPQVYSDGKKFRWKDRHIDAPGFEVKEYYYSINVRHRAGAVNCGVFDPKIANQ